MLKKQENSKITYQKNDVYQTKKNFNQIDQIIQINLNPKNIHIYLTLIILTHFLIQYIIILFIRSHH